MRKSPEGWIETTLDKLLHSMESGSRPRGGVRGITEGKPSIGGEHLNDEGGFRLDNIKYVPDEFYHRMSRGRIRTGDVLVVKDGATTGKVALVRPDFPHSEAVVNEHVFACRPVEGVLPAFLFWYLYSKEGQERILQNFQGAAQGGINQSFAAGTAVPLAPAPEQKRIVAKLDSLVGRVNYAQARLAKVPATVKHLRQSILAAACSGHLTAEWRGSQESVAPDNDLPRGWQLASVARLASKEPRSIQSGPFGSNLLHAEFQKSGVLAIGIDNVLRGEFSLGREHRISRAKFAELEKYRARPGDVLITVMATIGRVCVVPEYLEPAIITKHVYRVTPDRSQIESRYLMFSLMGDPDLVADMADQVRGQTRPGINGVILKGLKVRLPPLPEQREIIRRVDALFAFADKIESHVRSATIRTDRLTHAVLARAFRGELVTTEAELAAKEGRHYEPASMLLERIQESRKQHVPLKPERGEKTMVKRISRRPAKVRRPLDEILREQRKPLAPERLFAIAGFDEDSVDGFYEQLRKLIKEGKIRESRPNTKDVRLEAVPE